MKSVPRFSKESLSFLLEASRQKSETWLDRNRERYEVLLLEPLKHLAVELKSKLGKLAPGYHFPQKGIGRLKRSRERAKVDGLYRDWMHYSAARPRSSRFEHNPNLYFLLNPEDRDDPVLLAGGLYMPSSRQLRAIRESIAADASAFEKLFRSRSFSAHFRGGFAREKISSRPPRGFDPAHPKMDWLKLQAFYVWKPYSLAQFTSASFAGRGVEDCRQILRLNELLDAALSGKPVHVDRPARPRRTSGRGDVSDRLESVEAPKWEMDF